MMNALLSRHGLDFDRLAADGFRAAPFALYVLWLTAFPMSGPLLGSDVAMDWFLWPHAFGMLACAHRLVKHYCRQIFFAGTLLTALMTLLYADGALGHASLILAVMGVVAAPLLLKTLLLLKTTPYPVFLSALCLGAGNLGMLALTELALSDGFKLAFLSCALLSTLFVPLALSDAQAGQEVKICRYLPFIFLFQITSGLMYGLLLPFYHQHAWLPGSELLLYIIAAIVAGKYLVNKREMMLVSGTLFAAIAYVFFQIPIDMLAGNASVWSMMLTAGIIDIAILAFAFSFQEPLRGCAFFFATMLGGIASGSQMARWLGGNSLQGAVALSALILSTITLLFARPDQPSLAAPVPPALPNGLPTELPPVAEETAKPPRQSLLSLPPPEMATHPFSPQEWRVLQAVAQYQTYREAATALGITESSVKTYMQRMYKKTGTFRRQQLLDKVTADFGPIPPH